MTKHAAFLIFCLLLPISACSTDDWITQECATLPSDTSDLACQCHFHDLLKLASETHKTNKRVKITPRPATKHKSKSLETLQTSPNQSQADMQAQAGGFDFTNELPEAEPINTNSDSNTAKTSGMNELQAQADGFDFTNDLSDAEHIDARSDTNTAKTSGLNVLQAQADGFDFTNDSFDFTEHAAKSAFAVPPIPSPAQAAPTTGMTEQACIDINTADIPELMHLPGIGKSRAQAIVASREHRAFKRKKDIKRIKGIGNKSYLKLAAIICDI
ncbi:MAG: helix-hairpin-helix domain-containing protein [Proteobacteria bacterium]|nr:helix-hairpin-helix domain-containing protein [Pseudomonadota bacterium]